jgi:hypothetical protein
VKRFWGRHGYFPYNDLTAVVEVPTVRRAVTPCPWRPRLGSIPIIQAMRVPSRALLVVRRLAGTARTIGGPDLIPHACRGLALMGLMVGSFPVVLLCAVISWASPDAPEAPQAAVMGPQASRSCDGLAREDCNLDGDDPWARVALTAEGLVLPSTPFSGRPRVTPAYSWPVRYLVRPQQLTRSAPLPWEGHPSVHPFSTHSPDRSLVEVGR